MLALFHAVAAKKKKNRAEQQATLLENQLRALESKIGEFLDEHDADVDVDAPDPNAGTADMQACAAREHAPAGSSNNSSNTDDASKKQTNGA